MSNELTTPASSGMLMAGGTTLVPQSIGEAIRFAELMADSGIAVPKHLRRNPGACLAVAMQAFRWEMEPFSVAQKTYLVNDTIAYEAQLIVAVINARAPIGKGGLTYTFTGEGAKRQCHIDGVDISGEVKEYTSPEIGSINPKNSPLWKTDPDQQLGYYSARAWARRHYPEIILGVYDPEEIAAENARDITPPRSPVVEKLAQRREAAGERKGFDADQISREIGAAATATEVVDIGAGNVLHAEERVMQDAPTPQAAEQNAAVSVTKTVTAEAEQKAQPREDHLLALNKMLWKASSSQALDKQMEAYKAEYGSPAEAIREIAVRVWNTHKKRVDSAQEITAAEIRSVLEPLLGNRWEEGRPG
jgi:hypothetical protein